MPTAYIYRGTFEVRAGETLRYVEVAADGTISPEVTKTYAELAGSGSVAAAAVSLTPTVAAPTLTGVQIGAIEGVPVSLQPTVSPAAVSGVQVGVIAAASVSLRPTVAAPSVIGVMVGNIAAAAVSLQPSVATGELTGVVAQTGSISAAAVTCQPVVAVGTLTGVEQQTNAPVTLDFETADIVDSSGATWTKEIFAASYPGDTPGSITSGVVGGDTGNALAIVGGAWDDGEAYGNSASYIVRTMNVAAGQINVRFKNVDGNLLTVSVNGDVTIRNGSTGQWTTETIPVPAPLVNAVIKIGCSGYRAASLIDNVSIPQ